jgi:uncharacterized metal-binding protein
MEPIKSECAKCGSKTKACRFLEGKGPALCPTANQKKILEKAAKEYKKPEIRKFAQIASIQEASCYINRDQKPYVFHPSKPRVQETCEFAQKMGYKKIGLAFCLGLANEAMTFNRIMEAQGLEVVSAVCKVGAVPKEEIGVEEKDKVFIGEFDVMCNPIAQAMIMNEAGTEFNVLIGLCVGHDSLVVKYSEAPCTVLVVKDRVLCHNPAAALYTSNGFYSRMLRKGF